MEKLDYRDTLSVLMQMFGGKMVLSAKEVGRVFGIDPRTARKRYPFKGTMIELTRLASAMCLSSDEIRKAGRLW